MRLTLKVHQLNSYLERGINMAKIGVIGGGSWGTALTQLLLDNNHQCKMFTIEEDVINSINTLHKTKYFEDVVLHDSLIATSDLKTVVDFADYLLLVVPTKVMRVVLKQINGVVTGKKTFINASKGIEPETFKRMSEIVTDEIDPSNFNGFVSLTGPSHAEEVILRMLTTVVSASEDISLARDVQVIFNNNDYFRVYTSTDVVGAEMGASLKNIIALASGIISGLGFGDNTRAALITRGIVEMIGLSVAMGANPNTLLGLTGIGDLIVTCTSKHSRNFQAGYQIGSGSDLNEALDSITMVVEGARSAKAAYDLAKSLNVEIPIIAATYDVIYNKVDPKTSMAKLMSRNLKDEY
jgi:glycerol-3-phosphate dehydrogenase (NAD(P)+)